MTVLGRPGLVVSLLPAATEIVAALGATGRLVGVSHECDYPPDVRALPRVTSTTVDTARPSAAIDGQMAAARAAGDPPVRVDLELLRRLAPDILIGQSVCDVCAVGEDELARAAAAVVPRPAVVTLHAHSLDGVFRDIERVGTALDLADEAAELVGGLRYRLRRVRRSLSPVRGRGTGGEVRVLVLEWLDPPYVAGHWVPELIEIAGGVDVGSRPGERSRPRPWAALRGLAPDVVVIACCGFDISRARMEFAAVHDPDALALFRRRVEFLDGNAYTSRPGPRLVDAAEILSRLIAG
ncbi:MAG: ABC transporter substrate-binding protein [Gemmatimonadales bacterium]